MPKSVILMQLYLLKLAKSKEDCEVGCEGDCEIDGERGGKDGREGDEDADCGEVGGKDGGEDGGEVEWLILRQTYRQMDIALLI